MANRLPMQKASVVCDNCGQSAPQITAESGRFCDHECAEAYDLR